MSRPAVVYVAGPFRGRHHWEIAENIRNAERLALRVWQSGAVALCPHLNTLHFQGVMDDKVWLDGDLELVRRCDAVVFTPDFERSTGAKAEYDFATSLGRPCFVTLDALDAWLRDKRAW